MDHATVTPVPVRRAGKAIGEYVSEWRRLQRLPQTVVAARAGVSVSTLRRVEKGDLGTSLETLLRIARALGRLDDLRDALDPMNSDLGRIRLSAAIPRRVRT